ncbi:hypothetical protein DWZ14_06115 [Enterocloster citroniae]|nr:hypothetical protein DWZ14_06115 [Enterocloster citroniae]
MTNALHCIKIRVNKINRRERGVSFQSINTESRRWWDCGIRLAAEWTFEGGPERLFRMDRRIPQPLCMRHI